MSDLSPEVRELLSAIRDAVDLPHPDTTGDAQDHDAQLARRTVPVSVVLASILDETHPIDLATDARFLRGKLAQLDGEQ